MATFDPILEGYRAIVIFAIQMLKNGQKRIIKVANGTKWVASNICGHIGPFETVCDHFCPFKKLKKMALFDHFYETLKFSFFSLKWFQMVINGQKWGINNICGPVISCGTVWNHLWPL